jgi:undecaprenyl-diphosphatase
VVAQQWMGIRSPDILLYDIFFHAGTLVAVLFYFRRDIWQLTRHINRSENRQLAGWIILGSIPTALMGILAKDWIETLFHSTRAAGIGLLITALLLALSTRLRFKKPPMWLAALLIGVIQGIAITPGISRSGSTISLALILSLGYAFAFRFSFLLSIPAVGGAFLLELLQMKQVPDSWLMVGIGVAVAALFGLGALWLLERVMQKNRLHYFAVYCVLLGVAVLVLSR